MNWQQQLQTGITNTEQNTSFQSRLNNNYCTMAHTNSNKHFMAIVPGQLVNLYQLAPWRILLY